MSSVQRLPRAGEPVDNTSSYAQMPDGSMVREYKSVEDFRRERNVDETSSSIPFSAHRFRKVKTGNMQFGRAQGNCLDCGMDIKDPNLMANLCLGVEQQAGAISLHVTIVEHKAAAEAAPAQVDVSARAGSVDGAAA